MIHSQNQMGAPPNVRLKFKTVAIYGGRLISNNFAWYKVGPYVLSLCGTDLGSMLYQQERASEGLRLEKDM